MAVEDSKSKDIFRGGKDGERKEVGLAIRRRRANNRSINIKD